MAAEEAKIRIVSVPPGDAPLWVREKWVGLELPVVGGPKPATVRSVGVLSKLSFVGFLMSLFHLRGHAATGYVVDAKRAIDVLGNSHPEAAAWWRKNTPQILTQGRRFVFQKNACQLIASA